MTPPKKVLVITRNYPPLWGGMERLNLNMVEQLAKRFDVRLVAPYGAEKHCSKSVKAIEVPLRPLVQFMALSAIKACQEARAWGPDVIVAGSGLIAPIAWLAGKFCRGKAVVYAHGLDLAFLHPLYRLLWHPALRQSDLIVANSCATAELAKKIGVSEGHIRIVHPGVNASCDEALSSALDRHERKHEFCRRYKIGEGPLLLSVGRLTERKGLREFVSDVLPEISRVYSNVSLLVIGDAPSDSLYARSQSIESIKKAAKLAGVERKVHFLGRRFGSGLAEAYQAADLHVFPVREIPGDPEGFGMVAIEAAANGLATVAYSTGGVVDAVLDGVSGRLVSSGDNQRFAEEVIQLLENPLRLEPMLKFANGFSWGKFGSKLEKIVNDLG